MKIAAIRNKLQHDVEIPHPASAGFGMTTLFCVRGEESLHCVFLIIYP
jgi:hypothetical protein